MQIEQKKFSNRHIFTFDTEAFNFAYQDKTGSGDMDIPYADCPLKSSIRIEQNLWLRNVGFIWCVLGVLQMGYAVSAGRSLSGTGFWLMIGALCVFWAYWTKVTYTVFLTDRGSVFIIQDGTNHDKIIDEIFSRRKNQLLTWYGAINLENGLEKEIGKYRWLTEQKVITKEEADLRIAQVEAAFRETNATSSRMTH